MFRLVLLENAFIIYEIPPKFKIKHGISTRSNGMMLRLPQVKSENGRKCFSFQATLIFNNLPNKVKSETKFSIFKKMVSEYY